jgi:glycosyltransferase involved in cell wall biosynthesis
MLRIPGTGTVRHVDPSASLERLPGRILVTSPVAPPHDSGQAMVLERLYRGVDPADYRILVFDMEETPTDRGGPPLPHTTHIPRSWQGGQHGSGAAGFLASGRVAGAEIARRAAVIASMAKDEQCDAILATTGQLPSLPAAVAAGKLARLPVVLQVFDHWRLQGTTPSERWLGSALEPSVMRAADAVIVPNELLADAIQRTSGIRPIIVRNPVDDAALDDRPELPWPVDPEQLNIVYTGQVYDAQLDSLERVALALRERGLKHARLHIFHAGGQAINDRLSRWKRVELHPFITPPDIYEVQRTADVLLVPLAFAGMYRDIIRTSSTTKLADSLAAGRPVLIHCPPQAFPAWYATRHRCGLVAGSPSVDTVAGALRLLERDPALRERISAAALERARADFSIAAARAALRRVLGDVLGRVA